MLIKTITKLSTLNFEKQKTISSFNNLYIND